MGKYRIIIYLIILVLLTSCQQNQNIPLHRLQWYIDPLYDSTCGEKTIKIAVVDTGVNEKHLDLDISKAIVMPTIDLDYNKNYGHATAVAGVIAAYPHDKKGVLGINSKAKIISVDVMDDSEQSDVKCLINAIQICMKEDVDIINISLGINFDDDQLHSIIKEAYKKGIVIVAAIGNEYDEDVLYPAAYDEVISVGSADKDQNIMYKSIDVSDVYAPGVNIVTTFYDPKEGLGYSSLNGSSISAPIVSGVVSKVMEKRPDITNVQIYEGIKKIKYVYSIESVYKEFGISI